MTSSLENSTASSAEEHRPLLVSFSGIDGSGKSTQIENLISYLHRLGKRTVLLAFWDDVTVGKRFREGFVHKVYKSEAGVGTPDKPVERRDKNVRRWYLSLARHLLYLLDAINLCEIVGRAKRGSPDVIIIDRYIYDELANLPLRNPLTRMFVAAIHAFVPRPDVAYLLDADVNAARKRKPEYPVEFLRTCREAYFLLAHRLGTLQIIPPLSVIEAKNAVISAFQRLTKGSRHAGPVGFDQVAS